METGRLEDDGLLHTEVKYPVLSQIRCIKLDMQQSSREFAFRGSPQIICVSAVAWLSAREEK